MLQAFRAWRDRAFKSTPSDTGEITLTQRRVYLLPSGRGLAVLIAGLVMLLVGVNYGVSLAYLAAFLIAGYLHSSLISAYRNMVGLKIMLLKSEDAHVGEALRFTLNVSSDRRREGLVFATAQTASVLDDCTTGLQPVTLRVPATARGIVHLGRVRIQSVAPTGLIRAFSYVHFESEAYAYPALANPAPPVPAYARVPVRAQARAADAAVAAAHARSGDALDGVREYVQGDPLARVVWSAAARGQAWRSKLMTTEAAQRLHFAWQHTANLPGIEARASALAAWVALAHTGGAQYGLSLPGVDIPAAQSAAHKQACLRALATV
jgi:uncharacterized protein (DUF58 family)